ncbi:unnamed protein product [Withania somnifera]
MDGVGGTVCAGTGYYLKKEALYGSPINQDDMTSLFLKAQSEYKWESLISQSEESLQEAEQKFGASRKFINSVNSLNDQKNGREILCVEMIDEAKTLASCTFEENTSWGKEVTSPWFALFTTIFLSSLAEHLYEVLSSGGNLRTWWNEQRIWIIKTVTACLFGCLDVLMKWLGVAKANFRLTNKAIDEEKLRKYEKGKFDFQGAKLFMVPLTFLVVFNVVCFIFGMKRLASERNIEEMFGQAFLSFYLLVLSYPILEGLVSKKDK